MIIEQVREKSDKWVTGKWLEVVSNVDPIMKLFFSRLFGKAGNEKQAWETTPGGPYEVTITEEKLVCNHRKRSTESIRWDQVREIWLVTNSDGPILPDVWYVFSGDCEGCSVPSEANGFDQLWDVFESRFPTIEYEAIIAAGTGDEKKVIWRS